MHTNSINKLLDLKEIYVKNIQHSDSKVMFYITTKPKPCVCPACGQVTSKVHDYRDQEIKDLPMMKKHTIIVLKKRRYVCTCKKKFYERYDFLPKYRRMTNRLSMHVCNEMRKCIPVSMIASDLNLSAPTVVRVFTHVQYPKPSTMPKVLAIDEFKGNAETGKYQCILVDPKKSKVLDILPDRKNSMLSDYFKSIPRHERHKVKHFVCDMWRPYADIAQTYFPHAKVIVDKYHFVRQVTWAIENVRKRVQKSMDDNLRRYFKRSRTLILKRKHKLTSDQNERLQIMLLFNDDLRQAYRLKEEFYDLCKMEKYSEQRKAFADWIKYAEALSIPEFKACIRAFRNWYKEILNAFKYGYTNGPTEGFNNKIKVLKRTCYGIKNFNRFRNRILHICS